MASGELSADNLAEIAPEQTAAGKSGCVKSGCLMPREEH